jgi:hypothetical protein
MRISKTGLTLLKSFNPVLLTSTTKLKYLFVTLILFVSLSCSKKVTDPAPQTDSLTNTTWVRYGFKSPVTNKDVYYYLAFKSGSKGQDYTKYNKTDPTDTPPVDFTYQQISATAVNMSFPAGTITGVIAGNKLTVTSKTGTVDYTKE